MFGFQGADQDSRCNHTEQLRHDEYPMFCKQ